MWNAKQEKKKIKKRDDDNVEFIVNTMSNSNLSFQMNEQMKKQTNYMTFDLDDENHFEQCHGPVPPTQSGGQYQGGLVSEIKRRGFISFHNPFFLSHFFDLLLLITR
jgi:hypothetical protein